MTRDASSLYRDILVEHGDHPRGAGPLPDATNQATAHNPLCGDRVTIRVRIDGNVLADVRFEAKGCLIARASASLMAEALTGRSLDEALATASSIGALVGDESPPDALGTLEPLRAVREFPARKSCVVLVWDDLRQALASRPQ